jgi:hypothetical protein
MNPLWLVAVAVGVPSLAWMVVRWRETHVYQRISEQALQDCPAGERSGVLRALAEVGSKLRSERPSVGVPPRQRSGAPGPSA